MKTKAEVMKMIDNIKGSESNCPTVNTIYVIWGKGAMSWSVPLYARELGYVNASGLAMLKMQMGRGYGILNIKNEEGDIGLLLGRSDDGITNIDDDVLNGILSLAK